MKPSCLYLLLLVCVGFAQAAPAQTFSVTGRVADEAGSPLEGAAVFATRASRIPVTEPPSTLYADASITARTDARGRYQLAGLAPGTYTITAFVAGKKTASRSAVITSRDVRVDFTLALLEGELGEITVGVERPRTFGLDRLPAVAGAALNEARKNEVIVVDDITANLATNNSRQVYARVAGLNIWESDGAGVQLGIGGRGLSPNRNANFNTRQNGYDIAADALGYPESYYTPPVQALERIEIIRGAASLQYGTQFGGVLNFVFKEGPANKPFELTSMQTYGSFRLFNSFNSLGGGTGKLRYYSFYQYKRSDGWRPNAGLSQHTAYASVRYTPTERLTVRPEYTFTHYLARQPGGLTDAQFEADARQSNRARNWFRVNWNLFALTADYTFSPRTLLNTRFFGLVAGRDAVGNLGRIDRLDFGGNRDLLRDRFRNWGNETRLVYRYPLLNQFSVFLVGTRLYNGFTDRKQGEGSDGSDADFAYLHPDNLEGSDFDLPSRNVSVFTENIFHLTPRLSLTPGIRFEYIRTAAEGYYRNTVRDLAGNVLVDERVEEQKTRTRSFVFFGLGASYKRGPALELYANFSQNYRAINFNDIRVSVGSLKVDPEIRDERGFNLELGTRGGVAGLLTYDVSLFHLSYTDRIGTVLRTEPNPQFNNLVDRVVRLRTNLADARIFGLESFGELDVYRLLVDRTGTTRLSVFTNLALITAEYARSEEHGIAGNRVEQVPEVNLKTGLTVGSGRFEASFQLSRIGTHYSDASNAVRTPTAIEGLIPAYQVMDFSMKYAFNRFRVEAGVNNLTDAQYFTRRATGYPGPGIIPADGRSLYLTTGVRF